jgi:hypothetical protein
VLFRSLNIIGFSSPKQGIYDDINLSDDIDSYYSNIDSSSFKENLIDDNYLNYKVPANAQVIMPAEQNLTTI